ncbi:OmpA family protein [Oceanirhabdus sp. W0125-5]|uniref:OmpA family protein n=1 Tax=Oceanirhabdus sp. W0125-5 TaxID=2999116 RepID=UPI0022F30736|nr:OmpA family protein [Oceanirhabdus sp. W0125-5]WBW98526.1 OmpA family protein [Oceanirhabdus sp. W0125-5]
MKRRKRYRDGESVENFWPSFTDMISTIALILFLLVFLAFIQQIVTGSNLEATKKRLEAENKKLELTTAALNKEQEKLLLMKQELETTRAEVEQGQQALQLSLIQSEEQRKIIAESNQELGNLRAKLQSVALIRVNVLNQVKEAIEKEMGQANGENFVTVAENGNLILSESILFDSGSYQIKSQSKEILNRLAVSFQKILEDDETRKYIDAIEIQGHADARQGAISNSMLSSNRATSVVDYLMSVNPVLGKKYGQYFAASGYSSYRPRVEGENQEAWKANRRIEISVIVKDPAIKNLINEYLEQD